MKRLFSVLLVVGLAISLLGIDGFAKEKERFRIKFLWQSESISQVPFSLSDYNLFANWNPRDYFGKWYGYSWRDDIDFGQLYTSTQLKYERGDVVPLGYRRKLSMEKTGRHFGLEAELKIVEIAEGRLGELWIGGSIFQTPTFTIVAIEEKEEMIFRKIEMLYADIEWSYYVYYMNLDRSSTIRKTSERFSSRNFQIYTKYEFGTSFLQVFVGLGLDVWKLNRKVEIEEITYNLMPWSRKEIVKDRKEESDEYLDTDWFLQPFMLMGIQVPIPFVEGLRAGVQGNAFLGDKYFDYSVDFLLPVSEKFNHWTMKLADSSIVVYLSLGF